MKPNAIRALRRFHRLGYFPFQTCVFNVFFICSFFFLFGSGPGVCFQSVCLLRGNAFVAWESTCCGQVTCWILVHQSFGTDATGNCQQGCRLLRAARVRSQPQRGWPAASSGHPGGACRRDKQLGGLETASCCCSWLAEAFCCWCDACADKLAESCRRIMWRWPLPRRHILINRIWKVKKP